MWGSQLTFLALPLVAYDSTGSATVFAGMLASTSLGMLLTMLIGGALADRFDRQRMMLVSDAMLLVLILGLGISVRMDAWKCAMAFVFCQALVSSMLKAGQALQRDIVPDEHRSQANALTTLTLNVGSVAAPLAGAAIYATVGFDVIVAIDAMTYVVSFLLLLGVRDPRRDTAKLMPAVRPVQLLARTGRDIRAGVSLVRRDAYTRRAILAQLPWGIANSFFMVAAVPWIHGSLGLPTEAFGAMIALFGCAGIVASIVIARVGTHIAPQRLIAAGAIVSMIAAAGFIGGPPLWIVVPCLLMFGVANVMSSVGALTLQQRRFGSREQGRVASLDMVMFTASALVGYAVAGVLVSLVEPWLVMSSFGAGLLAGAFVELWALRRVHVPAATAADRDLAVSA